ncbi:HesA/MoeB/ThiF family protein [Desulfobacula toluolica]|uniref:ThiF/MoeB family protein n=1 Tax=Desulfobacula toluolica (strain DSM 7467 / Tol2) TaxID=651182 RepID=K0NIU4_DESTT|nr:HesA/MoeB/ThiF family protein [Desulfobacula toluolica]CCK79743.1 ThiF/MoeB family protein [Desulfobacula toluolica Tol2]
MRYARQTILPQIGTSGQAKLFKACVLIAGAGGLGSISSYYLAAAGIGNLIIVDNDTVELSNLNRQIIHCEADLGKPKAVSAAQSLERLNSSIRIRPVKVKITDASICHLLENVDIIVDACDNIQTRHVLNRASLKKKIPYIFGGVNGFDGMASTFIPGKTPCFNCLFSNKDRRETITGIIGPAAGVIGSFQAMEAIKLLLDIGKNLSNRLIRVSGMDMRTTVTPLETHPACPTCHGINSKKENSQ